MPAPPSAPATVPILKPAWKRGMIACCSRCSTAAPSTFMATSQVPMLNPIRNSPSHGQRDPGVVADPEDGQAERHPERGEHHGPGGASRVITTPASGRATREPTATANRISPSRDGDACRASRICGIRDAQLAKAKPLPMKAR